MTPQLQISRSCRSTEGRIRSLKEVGGDTTRLFEVDYVVVRLRYVKRRRGLLGAAEARNVWLCGRSDDRRSYLQDQKRVEAPPHDGHARRREPNGTMGLG